MKKFFCPICGNKLKAIFAIGDICCCCGNQSRLDDDITFDELKKFTKNDFKVSCRGDKKFKRFWGSLPYDVEHDLLRAQWINKGCVWIAGWQVKAIDIIGYVGSSGTIVFSTRNASDTIYTTAVLIDNIFRRDTFG